MFCFLDFETRSKSDLKTEGAHKYASDISTDIVALSWAFSEGEGHLWSPKQYWHGENDSLESLLKHIRDGGYVVAWNAAFDYAIWDYVGTNVYDWPKLPQNQVLCAQAQAEANMLPGKLEKAAHRLGAEHRKDSRGAHLIRTLCNGNNEWEDRFYGEEFMGHFRTYCRYDVLTMREIFQKTRLLSSEEWCDYWVSEEINSRGVAVDAEFAKAATHFATEESSSLNIELSEVTGEDMRLTDHTKKGKWLAKQLEDDPELLKIVTLTKKRAKTGEKYETISAGTEVRAELLNKLEREDCTLDPGKRRRIVEFCDILEAGNSAAVRKFKRITSMQFDGRVRGQYVFNGGGQTGRFASRGIQIHNLIRKGLGSAPGEDKTIDAIETVIKYSDASSKERKKVVNALIKTHNLPFQKILARLIRPTFIAPPGKLLLWGDWSQIEARVLPWLSGKGDKVLDAFRAYDRKEGLDIYKIAAGGIFGVKPDKITDDQRQIGKVAVLALGFGGGLGAFQNMAGAYGLALDDETAKKTVWAWRDANKWAVNFWYDLKDQMHNAICAPKTWFHSGRVKYLYNPTSMNGHGALYCALPCGRVLTYPKIRRKKEKNPWTGRQEWTVFYCKPFSGSWVVNRLWHGILAENITQATAASILRVALRLFRDDVVLHTHDEIVREINETDLEREIESTKRGMETIPDWADGLPLAADIQYGPYYTK